MPRVAAGIVQHCADDDWFHQTPAFAGLSLELCHLLRGRLPADDGFRPHFLGHILVEILLDAELIADNPARLDAYYAAVESIDRQAVQNAVNAMSAHDRQPGDVHRAVFARAVLVGLRRGCQTVGSPQSGHAPRRPARAAARRDRLPGRGAREVALHKNELLAA